jgi:hypothetical protein
MYILFFQIPSEKNNIILSQFSFNLILGPVYNRYSHQVTVDTLVLGDATAKYI